MVSAPFLLKSYLCPIQIQVRFSGCGVWSILVGFILDAYSNQTKLSDIWSLFNFCRIPIGSLFKSKWDPLNVETATFLWGSCSDPIQIRMRSNCVYIHINKKISGFREEGDTRSSERNVQCQSTTLCDVYCLLVKSPHWFLLYYFLLFPAVAMSLWLSVIRDIWIKMPLVTLPTSVSKRYDFICVGWLSSSLPWESNK